MRKTEFASFTKQLIYNGNEKLVETLKLLVYKEDVKLFELLDFDNNEIFLEPLIIPYFKNKYKTHNYSLGQILFGYIIDPTINFKIEVVSNETGIIYLPNYGYLNTSIPSSVFYLSKENSIVQLFNINQDTYIKFQFEPLIKHDSFDCISCSIPILNEWYYDFENNIIEVTTDHLINIYKNELFKALNIIHEILPNHYDLLLLSTKKIILFDDNTDPFSLIGCKRNSFTTFNTHGIVYFNTYQKELCNYIFFLEDIAHQCAHVIHKSMSFKNNEMYKVDPFEVIISNSIFGKDLDKKEKRDFDTHFNALYTYYAILLILDSSIDNKIYNSKSEEIELLSRIGYTLLKCQYDLEIFEPLNSEEYARNIYGNDGLIIYHNIKSLFITMHNKYNEITKDYKYINQIYNFDFRVFREENNI